MATIPINFQITFERPNATGLATLDGRRFRMTIRSSPRRLGVEGLEPVDPNDPERPRRTLATFRLTLTNLAGETLIDGQRLALGNDRWSYLKHDPRIPQGSLNVLALSEPGFEPTRGTPQEVGGMSGVDLGQRVVLEYVEVES